MLALRKFGFVSEICFKALEKNIYSKIQTASYAKSIGGAKKMGQKVAVAAEKVKLPVEKDPERLANYVCGSNINQEGEDIKLNEDSEYPDWLWNLRLGPPPPLEELDPNTLYYWRRVRKINMRKANSIKKRKKLPRMIVNDFDFRGGHYTLE